MLGYVTLGTNKFTEAIEFYDQLLGELGGKRFMETDTFVAWMTAPGRPGVLVTKPYDGQPATVGNGMMVALAVDTPDKVAEIYAKALELGATDEGEPGPRGDTFYAGYFRDLDGNKLNVFCMTESG